MKKGTFLKRIPLLLGGVMVLVSSCGMKDDIADLTNRVDALEGNLTTVQEQVLSLQSSVEDLMAFDEVLSGSIETLKKADETLGSRIDGLKSELSGKISDLETRLTGEIGDLKEATKKNADDIADILDTIGKIEGAIAKLDDTYATDEALAEAIKGVNDALATAIKEVKEELTKTLGASFQEALKGYVAIAQFTEWKKDVATKSELEKVKADYKKAIDDALDAALADDGKITSKISSMIATAVKSLESRIAELEESVEDLLERVQSIVFVPEFSDGKATINYSKVGTTLVEAQSVLQYQVYPAACAKAIKAEHLSFEFKEVATRASEPCLEVVKVEEVKDEEGIINVYVNARNLSADFYKDVATVNYAASLVLNDKNAINIASSYTNLIAIKEADIKAVGVEIKNVTPNEYKIEYTNLEAKQPILNEHIVKFNIGGVDEWFTLDEMKDKGYDLSIKTFPIEYSVNDSTKPNVFVNTEAEGIVTVSLKEEKKDAVGLIETIAYKYAVGDVDVQASATVEVVKIQGSIALEIADGIKWNYAEDASSDAGLAVVSSLDKAVILVEGTKLPTETDYAAVIAGTLQSTEIMVNGVAATGVTATFGGTTAEPTLLLEGFEWGKEYAIKAVYSLANIDVTISVTVQTIDRVRDTILLTLAEEKKNLIYQLEFATLPELLDPIYEGAKSYLGSMSKADFLKEVLKTNTTGLYNVDAITINGVDATSMAKSKLIISDDGATITAGYFYDELSETKAAVDYVLNITTWYGQKIEISKRVNLIAPVYDFKHTPSWVVFNEETKDCYSNVLANYLPNIQSVALEEFSVKDVDMEVAFSVVDGAGLPVADLVAAHLKQEFYTTNAECTITDNKLAYTTKQESVPVKGRLFFDTGVNGEEWIDLATKFDDGKDYANYVVKRYDPIENSFSALDDVINLTEAKTYFSNTWERLSLKDFRNGLPNFYLISDGKWVVGNGSNGFANGKSVTDIYGLSISFSINKAASIIPDELESKITFENGILSFNNGAQLELQEKVEIVIDIIVSYPQGTKMTSSRVSIR